MQKNKKVIKGKDLLIHSANKEGRHDDYVRTGTGAHKSEKDYSRHKKHKGKKYDEED